MYLYRYVDNRLVYEAGIKEEIYEVIKETPKSYLIKRVSHFNLENPSRIQRLSLLSDARWIRKNARKKFAFETKEEAMRHYRFKKRSQVRILENKLLKAKERLEAAQNRDPSYDPEERYFHDFIFEYKKPYGGYTPRIMKGREFLTEEDFSFDAEL